MIHSNSLESLKEINSNGSKQARTKIILSVFKNNSHELRDCDILKILYPKSDNMNLVRPRITELHQKGILIEGEKSHAPNSNRTVRTSKIISNQETLF